MDEGNTLAYQKGEFVRLHFTCEGAPDHVNVHISSAEGPYQAWFKDVQLRVYGNTNVRQATVDGKPTKAWKADAGAVTFTAFPWTSAAHEINIQYNPQ